MDRRRRSSSRRTRRKASAPALAVERAIVPAPSAPALPAVPALPREPRYSALLDARAPLVLSAVSAGWQAIGLALVLVARRYGSTIVCAHFCVDLLAAGVTECYGETFDPDFFETYVDDFDARIGLETSPPETAAALVAEGRARARANGIVEPDVVDVWSRMLPALPDGRPAPSAWGATGTPIAVADLLAPRRSDDEGAWVEDAREPRCVVRRESPREH